MYILLSDLVFIKSLCENYPFAIHRPNTYVLQKKNMYISDIKIRIKNIGLDQLMTSCEGQIEGYTCK